MILKELKKNIEIGSHGMNHMNFNEDENNRNYYIRDFIDSKT